MTSVQPARTAVAVVAASMGMLTIPSVPIRADDLQQQLQQAQQLQAQAQQLQAQASARLTTGSGAAGSGSQAAAVAGAQLSVPTDGSVAPGLRGNARDLAAAALAGPATFPPPVEPGPKPDKLSSPARRAVKLARASRDRPAVPRADADGYVRFTYGATQPTVVCAPARICVVSLQPGEVIPGARDSKDVGHFTVSDTVNWTVEPMLSGSGRTLVTQLAIRPSLPNLQSTLVVPTQRRLYSFTLRSTSSTWMPLIAFDYPGDDARRASASYRDQLLALQGATDTGVGGMGAPITDIDFSYELAGDAPWRPTAVYTDGKRTIVAFPPSVGSTEMPVLVGLGNDGGWFSDPTQTVLNSSVLPGHRLLVDGVLTRAALVSGVGDDQTEVRITRRAR